MFESDYLKENEYILKKIRQMPTLGPFDQKGLRGALSLSKIRKYAPGELILEQGSFDEWIYFLVSGKVRISKNGKDLTTLKRQGDVFGEMSAIDGSVRSASAYAVDETVCLATDASCIDKISGNDKIAFCYILYRVFAESLATRLRTANEELMKLTGENARLKRRLEKKNKKKR